MDDFFLEYMTDDEGIRTFEDVLFTMVGFDKTLTDNSNTLPCNISLQLYELEKLMNYIRELNHDNVYNAYLLYQEVLTKKFDEKVNTFNKYGEDISDSGYKRYVESMIKQLRNGTLLDGKIDSKVEKIKNEVEKLYPEARYDENKKQIIFDKLKPVTVTQKYNKFTCCDTDSDECGTEDKLITYTKGNPMKESSTDEDGKTDEESKSKNMWDLGIVGYYFIKTPVYIYITVILLIFLFVILFI